MRQEQRMVVAEREVNSSAECATVFRRWAFQWVLQLDYELRARSALADLARACVGVTSPT